MATSHLTGGLGGGGLTNQVYERLIYGTCEYGYENTGLSIPSMSGFSHRLQQGCFDIWNGTARYAGCRVRVYGNVEGEDWEFSFDGNLNNLLNSINSTIPNNGSNYTISSNFLMMEFFDYIDPEMYIGKIYVWNDGYTHITGKSFVPQSNNPLLPNRYYADSGDLPTSWITQAFQEVWGVTPSSVDWKLVWTPINRRTFYKLPALQINLFNSDSMDPSNAINRKWYNTSTNSIEDLNVSTGARIYYGKFCYIENNSSWQFLNNIDDDGNMENYYMYVRTVYEYYNPGTAIVVVYGVYEEGNFDRKAIFVKPVGVTSARVQYSAARNANALLILSMGFDTTPTRIVRKLNIYNDHVYRGFPSRGESYVADTIVSLSGIFNRVRNKETFKIAVRRDGHISIPSRQTLRIVSGGWARRTLLLT